MPLPATRLTVPDVGAAGDQGSGIAPRTHTQIGRLFRCRQPVQWQVRSRPVRYLQCTDLRNLSEEVAAAPFARQTHGCCAGQRQIPPCHPADAFTQKIPESADLALSAAIQPAIGTGRTRLEAGPTYGNTQSFLSHIERSPRRRRNLLRPLAKTKLNLTSIMRHYLRRCV